MGKVQGGHAGSICKKRGRMRDPCKRDIMEQQIERMHGDGWAVDLDEGALRLLADCHDGIIGK